MNTSSPSSGDRHVPVSSQPVFRRHHKDQRIGVNDGGRQPLIARFVADDAKFQIAIGNFSRDTAGESAADLHFHAWVQVPVFFDVFQQIQAGGFVRADSQASRGVIAKFSDSVGQFGFQILEAAGEFEHCSPRVGQNNVARGTVEELFPQLGFQPLKSQRYSRLCAP